MTSDESSNVVAFAPRPKEAPPFSHVEIRLRPNCTLQLNAIDERGDVVTFEFALVAPVTAADLTRLVSAWDGWRGSSAAAS
jgi:hypothetical protein